MAIEKILKPKEQYKQFGQVFYVIC